MIGETNSVPGFQPTVEQQAILAHDPRQYGRILAGPGTGKSATFVALIDQLLSTATPPRLRLLTFTRAATGELAKKVAEHPFAAAERPSTIHSFAISILVRNPGAGGIPDPLRIADDWEDKNVVRPSLASRARVDVRTLDWLIREMAANWESLRPEQDPRVEPAMRDHFLGAWDEHRRVFGYTLLQELPYALRKALHNHPDLEGVDYDLLIVDEYQDLNACDLEVIKLIAGRGWAVIAAGDDDQSVYSFRKAAPDGIRRFLSDYSDAADYPLSITQRCGSKIIEWASHVIEGDPERPPRPRLAPAPGSPPGEVALLAFSGHMAEARGVARLIGKLVHSEGIPPGKILVLLRGDHQGSFSKPVKAELDRLSIPYSDPDHVDRLLAEQGNRRMIEIFGLLVDRQNSLAWASLLNLTTGIGENFVRYVYNRAVASRSRFGPALLAAHDCGFPGAPLGPARRARDLLQAVLGWLDTHTLPSGHDGSWGKWIVETAKGNVVPVPSNELRDLLLALDELAEGDTNLDRYLAQIAPLGKDRERNRSQGVRVMSMTAGKGLTVEAAIIAALEEGVIPRPDADLAEERRLLYVAMTRARKFVYGTWAQQRTGPTARAGTPRVRARRSYCRFLDGGPVESQDGDDYIRLRWGGTR